MKIHFMVFKGFRHWLAQCREHDICVQSRTREGLKDAVTAQVAGEMALARKHGNKFENIPPPPADIVDEISRRSIRYEFTVEAE